MSPQRRRPARAAARLRLREVEHAVDEVVLRLDKVLAPVQGRLTLPLLVVAQVDVLAPVVLEDLFLGPRVVLLADGADAAVLGPGDVRPGGTIEDVLQRERAGREREGAAGGDVATVASYRAAPPSLRAA